MKNIVLTFLMACMCLGLYAEDYHVSTGVQKKHALVEEFTGVRCPNCPSGHRAASNLIATYGGKVSVVAIHCGGYSISDGSMFDLTVPDGQGIGKLIGGAGGFFPNCIISRRLWEGNHMYMGVDKMRGYSEKVFAENAPVNLWAKADFDEEKSVINIRVEGYLTEDIAGEYPRLNLYVIQNKVLNMQAGGNMGNQYEHNHLLRDAITGVEGLKLDVVKKGSYFVKTFSYQLPTSYKQIKVDSNNIELIAFVTKGTTNVLNTLNIRLTRKPKPKPLQASIRPYRLEVTGGYRYNFVQLVMKNESDSVLHNATFDVQLNQSILQKEWKGELLPNKSVEVRLDVDWETAAVDKNVYQITLKTLNGKEVAHSKFNGVFYAPDVVPTDVVLEINTDKYASENTYQLCDMGGNVLQTFGPYPNRQAKTYVEPLQLKPGTNYCLEVLDRSGDGISPRTGSAVVFKTKEGKVLVNQPRISMFGFRFFVQTEASTGIADAAVADEAVKGVYNLSGKMVGTTRHLNELPTGVYIVRSAKGSEKIFIR